MSSFADEPDGREPQHGVGSGEHLDLAAQADSQAWHPVDLLLNQGSAEELLGMRNKVAKDPMSALDLADTVALLEQFRQLRTDASPEFAGKLQDVALHSDRFYRSHYQQKPSFWLMPLVASLAAAATYFLLWWFDAGQLWQPEQAKSLARVSDLELPHRAQVSVGAAGDDAGNWRTSASSELEPQVIAEAPLSPEEASWERAVAEIMSRLDQEASGHLREAFRNGIADDSDALKQWLDPRNALEVVRMEHELRANADVRIEALRSGGALADVDRLVQDLADGIAASLQARLADPASLASYTREQLREVSFGVRALIAAGSSVPRATALREGGNWLAQQLPHLHGESLVVALSGLMELATISGQHFEAVGVHGQRLVDDVLQPSDENWRRRLPELLAGRVAAGTLGEAGRMLKRLPAFGVSPERCRLVRQLMLAQLRDRRMVAQDRPEVLAAMLYGCSDLLDEQSGEGDRIGWQLLRWKPARLAPDFATVQQIAWSRTPGSRGYTRLQREIRQLAVLAAPENVADRAAFCMCLATNYAAYLGTLVPDYQ